MTRVLKVFIASPGDVQFERQIVTDAIHDLSPRTLEMFDVALDVIKWDDLSPVARPDQKGSHQEVINTRLADATIFVGILNRRYGTPDDEDPKHRSGTHMEFETAIQYRDRISILTYYKRPDSAEEPNSSSQDQQQLEKLAELKNLLRGERIPHHNYGNLEEFRQRIVLDLLEAAFLKTQDAIRRDHTRRFFRFGVDWRKHCAPSVLIGYPAIHKHNPGKEQSREDWGERLLPNVVYEDFKAIQKIESSISLIGVKDVNSVTTDFPGLRYRRGNRIWLCIPRNKPARIELKKLRSQAGKFKKSRVRFTHHPKSRSIEWLNEKGPAIRVRSPLHLYLKNNPNVRPRDKSSWDPRFGRIYAVDYAVISRFAVDDTRDPLGTDKFYHFFIAGIRGLGTWGAGWFIDRRPDALAALDRKAMVPGEPHGDIQILVEVVFDNYRILDVVDVSDKDQSYFDNQMDPDHISDRINKYHQPDIFDDGHGTEDIAGSAKGKPE